MAEQIGLRAVFDISQFNKGLGTYNKGIDRANKKTAGFTTKAGKAFTGLGKSALKFGAIAGGVALGGVVALGAGLVAFGVSATKEGAAFTKAMSNVGAISGAVGKEFGDLEQKARDLGRTTKFTATEAAEGMGFLAMAGFEVNEIISAMPGVLNLASAANMDLGRASDIVSNILSGFGEDASQTSRFVDVLAKTAASSNTSVEQLGQGMKFVAPVAEAFGFSVEQTSAALGILGDAGLQAGIAGRGLRGVLSKLGAPTKAAREAMGELGVEVFNLDGTMKSLPEIIGEFTEATKDMTDEQKSAALGAIFSRGEIAPLLVLMKKGEKGIADFGNELENSAGFAAKVAAKQLDNLSGDVTLFQSALSGVKIDVFKALEPVLRRIVQLGTDLLGKFGPALSVAFTNIAETIVRIVNVGRELFAVFQAGGAAGLAENLGITPQVAELIDKISSSIASLGQAILSFLLPGFNELAGGGLLDIINAAIIFLNENFDTLQNIVIAVGAVLASAAIVAIIVGIVAAINPFTLAIIGIGVAVGILATAWSENWGNIQAIALTALAVLQAVWAGIVASLQPMFTAFQEIGTAVSSLGITWSDVWNALMIATGIVAAVIGVALLGIISVVTGLVSAIAAGIASIIATFQELAGFFEQFVTGVLQLFQGNFSEGLLNIILGLTGIIVSTFQGALDLVVSIVSGFVASIIGFWQGLFDTLVGGSIIPDLVNGIVSWFGALSAPILEVVNGLINVVSSLFRSIIDFFTTGTTLELDFEQVIENLTVVLPEATKAFAVLVQAAFVGMTAAAQEYAKFLTNVIAKQTMPIAVKAHENFSASSLVVWTSITDLANIYNDLLMQIALESMPSLSAAFNTVRTTIETASKAIATAIGSIKTKLDTDVPGIIAKFGEVETAIGKVSAALGDLNIGKINELGTAFSGVKGKVEETIDKVQKLIDKINAIPPIPSGPSSTSTSAAKGLGFQAGTPGNTNGLLGLGFQIPQGFSNDSFGPIFAQSGEEMLVAPRETSIESLIFSRLANLLGNTSTVQGPTITNIYNFDMTVNTGASAQAVIGQFEVAKGLIGP